MKLVLPLFFGLMNLAAFAAMASDKGRAVRGARRIPERTLLLLAAVGGSLGALLGMLLFRHKTRHPRFYLGLPILFAAQIALAYLLLSV